MEKKRQERDRMYRERQKTFKIINKPAPKTSAERAKASRQRQKIKKSTTKDDFDKPAPKTSTKRASTTRCGTTIDAVFARFIDNLSTNLYVSHFSYHKPIVSIMEKNIHNEPIVPVMVEDMSIDESDV